MSMFWCGRHEGLKGKRMEKGDDGEALKLRSSPFSISFFSSFHFFCWVNLFVIKVRIGTTHLQGVEVGQEVVHGFRGVVFVFEKEALEVGHRGSLGNLVHHGVSKLLGQIFLWVEKLEENALDLGAVREIKEVLDVHPPGAHQRVIQPCHKVGGHEHHPSLLSSNSVQGIQ